MFLSLPGGQYAITRWQKRILQLKDKQHTLLMCLSLPGGQYAITQAQKQTAVAGH